MSIAQICLNILFVALILEGIRLAWNLVRDSLAESAGRTIPHSRRAQVTKEGPHVAD